MPLGDRRGPWGLGPMTGRGLGYCAGYAQPGYMNSYRGGFGYRRGFGRGFGFRFGRSLFSYFPYENVPLEHLAKNEAELLRSQAEILKNQLENIQKRIEVLEKEKTQD